MHHSQASKQRPLIIIVANVNPREYCGAAGGGLRPKDFDAMTVARFRGIYGVLGMWRYSTGISSEGITGFLLLKGNSVLAHTDFAILTPILAPP